MNISKNLYSLLFAAASLTACGTGGQHDAGKNGADSHGGHNAMAESSSVYAENVNKGIITEDTMKGSPERTAMTTIGGTHLHISYHSPGVKGRTIWGGLVAYNTVWVTGAHAATSLQLSNPIEIDNKKIDTGTYAIFTIPGEKEWIFILNKNYQQHLADEYTAADDVLRVKVKPAANKMTPRLTYAITRDGEKNGSIAMMWDTLKIAVPFKSL